MKADVAGCPKLPDHPLYVYTSENKNVRAAPYFLNLFSENCQSLDDDPDGVFKLRNVWINSQPRMERWTIDSDATFSQLSAIRSSKSPKILKIINDDCSGEIVGANPDFLVNTATLRLKSLISVSDTLTHSRQKVLSLLNTAIRDATAGIDQYNNGLRLCLYLNSQDSGSHDSSDSFSVTPTPRVKRPTPLKIDCCTDTERQNVLLMGSSLSDPTLSPTENERRYRANTPLFNNSSIDATYSFCDDLPNAHFDWTNSQQPSRLSARPNTPPVRHSSLSQFHPCVALLEADLLESADQLLDFKNKFARDTQILINAFDEAVVPFFSQQSQKSWRASFKTRAV
eukprot:TRINITY_DN32600_c0_g1_i1.p1 TRINITY_DN32600_c0_g1~~TRINITY_DN32600_c0_g1_i1.p1  ORF type:complete len:374 (-),score=24.72 TRINITY_DN32600_c0_g1_i1:125-1147(-)